MQIKVMLLVEDNHGDARLLREMMREQQSLAVDITHVETLGAAEAHLRDTAVDVILLDLGLPDGQGIEVVRRTRLAAPRVPLVVLTGQDDAVLALEALQAGAQDYLIKGQIDTRGLLRALRYAVERATAEDALFDEKERAEVTLKSIADAVACTDIAGNISYLNVAAERLTGWSSLEAAGKPLNEIVRIVGQDNPASAGNAGALSAAGRLVSNCVMIRRDGSATAVENSVAPIKDRRVSPWER